jgi:anti-anti-sigma factor
MGNEFSIERVGAKDTVAMFRVVGRLDAKSAQELMRVCREARAQGQRRVIVNLAGVTFVSSSGIGTLLALTEEFKEAGGGVHLVALSGAVTSVVDLLNLGQFLNLGQTESQVLQTIGA